LSGDNAAATSKKQLIDDATKTITDKNTFNRFITLDSDERTHNNILGRYNTQHSQLYKHCSQMNT